jgi:hypothetical protein
MPASCLKPISCSPRRSRSRQTRRAAGEGTKHPRIKHCASRRGAGLICQFATREMIKVGLKGSVPIAGHDCSVMAAKYVCSSVALRRSTVVCSCCAQATTVVRSDQAKESYECGSRKIREASTRWRICSLWVYERSRMLNPPRPCDVWWIYYPCNTYNVLRNDYVCSGWY